MRINMKHLATLVALCVSALAGAGDFFTRDQWIDLWKHGGGGTWTSLARQDVRDDLKLSNETCAKLDEMLRTFVKEQYALCKVSDEAERAKQIAKHKSDYLDNAKVLIGEEKFIRLMQIHLQLEGNSSIGDAYWQKVFNVDAGQRSRIQEADEKYNRQLSNLLFRWEEENMSNDEVQKELEQMETTLSSDCARIFSKEQIQRLMESRGERFAARYTALWWLMVRR
jgi:hypothetical protein